MANIILNGTTYDGNPASGTYWKPVRIAETLRKIGTVVEAEAGGRTLVQRAVKREWTITWEKVNESTRAGVIGLAGLGTTFAYVDEHGTSYTVQTEPGDHASETAFTSVTNVYYYNLELTLHEA